MTTMTPADFWQAYTGGMDPAEFILQFQSRNPRRCAEHHVRDLGCFLGIVRRGPWVDTFIAEDQHQREEVTCALTTYLEECREAWETKVREADTAASRTINEDAVHAEDEGDESSAEEASASMSDEELEAYYKETFGEEDGKKPGTAESGDSASEQAPSPIQEAPAPPESEAVVSPAEEPTVPPAPPEEISAAENEISVEEPKPE